MKKTKSQAVCTQHFRVNINQVKQVSVEPTIEKGLNVEDEIDFAMVRSINEIGQIMGMKTIAEYVEDAKILECLAKIGVDYVQGYGIAKPQTLDEYPSLLFPEEERQALAI